MGIAVDGDGPNHGWSAGGRRRENNEDGNKNAIPHHGSPACPKDPFGVQFLGRCQTSQMGVVRR
jgi:hypothetical protein